MHAVLCCQSESMQQLRVHAHTSIASRCAYSKHALLHGGSRAEWWWQITQKCWAQLASEGMIIKPQTTAYLRWQSARD